MAVFPATLLMAGSLAAGSLANLRETNRAAHDPAQAGALFSVEAQIITICRADGCRILNAEDGSDNGLLWDLTETTCRSGDRIRASGRIDPRPDGHRTVCITNLVVIGHAPFPAAIVCEGSQIVSGEMRGCSVSLRGVVMKVMREDLYPEWNWILLRTRSGTICVSASEYEYPIATLRPLVDAEVTLIGRAMKLGLWRKINHSSLLLYGTDAIRTLKKPPTTLLATPPVGNGDPLHRQRVCGTILARTDRRLFLSTDTGTFLPVRLADGTGEGRPGESVVAIGFVEPDPFDLRMTEAVILPAPEQTRTLPAAGQPIASIPISELTAAHHGNLFTLRGVVRSLPTHDNPFLTISDSRKFISADLSGIGGISDGALAAGDTVDLTGLCISEFSDAGPNASYPRFHGLTIVPRSAADIVVVAARPWWTPFRLLLVIVALLVLIAVGAVWITALKALSERRGRALFRENVARISADLRTEERTRLAVDLHDSLAQMLTGVSYQIDAGEFENASRSLKSCRDELRNCLWDLRNQALEQKDLGEAIRRTLRPHAGNVRIVVRFNVPRAKVSDTTVHSVLMIVRELVTNAIRHGKAKTVRIAGGLDGDALAFSVRDDGAGFDPTAAPGIAAGHFGLQGIRERVKRCDGTIAIDSAPGRGTKVTISLKRQK